MSLDELERAAQQARAAAEAAGEPFPPYVPWPKGPRQSDQLAAPAPDKIAGQVLATKVLTTGDLIAYCSPAKLALGVSARAIAGQVDASWSRKAVWGLGRRIVDGVLTESVALRCEHPDGRSVLFLWTRPPANPALMVALWSLGVMACLLRPWAVAAVLVALPTTKWTSAMVMTWERLAPGRITQPRPIPSAEAKKIIREG